MTTEPIQQCCATCVWFNQAAPSIATAERRADSDTRLGTCQLRPPAVIRTRYFAVSMFPETRDDRWCGMWEPVFGGPDDGGREDVPDDTVVHLRDRKAAA